MSSSQGLIDPFDAAMAEIARLKLEPYVAELESKGFTVIPPEVASPGGLASRLLEAILDVSEKRTGTRPEIIEGRAHENYKGRFADYYSDQGDSPIGEYLQCLLFEDRVFEEALMNPVLLAITTYLLGYSSVLSSMSCFIKGRNKSTFALHTDTLIPSPLPAHALICNATYLLTDFTKENGATAFVPGSHKFCRTPSAQESIVGGEDGHPDAVSAEGAAGSLMIFHGNTWHGAFNRTQPGLRVSMPVLMARPNMRTEEDLFGAVPQEMIDRNPGRFKVLTQQAVSYGFSSEEGAAHRSAKAAECLIAYFEEMGLKREDRIAFPHHG